MSTWKTRTEAYHGTKWGYAVIALVIVCFILILGVLMLSIQGKMPILNISAWALLLIVVVILIFLYLTIGSTLVSLSIAASKYLAIVLILAAILLTINILLVGTSISNIVLIVLCIALLIVFIIAGPFIIDLFSYEHE